MQHKPAPRSNPTDITVTEAVDLILERALERGASDIHLEPRERTVVVRYRIDGWLQEAAKFPLKRYAGVVKQIRRRVELDTEDQLPQHASTEFISDYGPVILDIATMPTVSGEKVVIHLKPQADEAANLENLGYWGDGLHELRQAIAEPHGLVLAASLNRTSLSATLISMVQDLNNPAYNITTLESPVTHRVPGITQTEVKPGATYPDYLKAALKTDPNVILVSSMQDRSTMTLSVQAALDGRLLLGGIHATDASHALRHSLQLNPETHMVATALKAVTSQRFVRKLCVHCRQPYIPGPEERSRLSALLKDNGIKTVAEVHALELKAIRHGLGHDEHGHLLPAASTTKRVARMWRANPHGCAQCRFTGYFGRLGLTEVLEPTDELREKIAKGATPAKIRQAAIKHGMVPLALDGFIKALRGMTSMDEVFRACA